MVSNVDEVWHVCFINDFIDQLKYLMESIDECRKEFSYNTSPEFDINLSDDPYMKMLNGIHDICLAYCKKKYGIFDAIFDKHQNNSSSYYEERSKFLEEIIEKITKIMVNETFYHDNIYGQDLTEAKISKLKSQFSEDKIMYNVMFDVIVAFNKLKKTEKYEILPKNKITIFDPPQSHNIQNPSKQR